MHVALAIGGRVEVDDGLGSAGALEDQSTNVFWLALPSLGESWHHNHHALPRSAAHGLRWWELDPSAPLIALMRRLGLAWDVVRIAPERQAQRLAEHARVPAR